VTGPNPPIAALEEALRARGLLPEGRALPPPPVGRPWFVSVLLGFSGWLAGLFGLLFVGLLFKPEHASGFGTLGLLLLAGSFGLYRVKEGAFVEQLALALSIAGHVAITVAIGEATDSPGATALLVALVQLGWLAVVGNGAACTLAALFACAAWALSVRFAFWGTALSFSRREVAFLPALFGWILVWGPVALAAVAAVRSEGRWMAAGRARIARPALVGLLLGLAWGPIASEPLAGLLTWEPDGAGVVNWLALWPLLSTAASILALALAHALRSRPLMGSAIAAALVHVVRFYLLLGVSLVAKSIVMATIGALLLGAAVLLARREPDRRGA
jgi:hypothetical protein